MRAEVLALLALLVQKVQVLTAEEVRTRAIRPSATSVCGLKLLVSAALSY